MPGHHGGWVRARTKRDIETTQAEERLRDRLAADRRRRRRWRVPAPPRPRSRAGELGLFLAVALVIAVVLSLTVG